MAELLACDLYLFLECNWFWHKIDTVYIPDFFGNNPFFHVGGPLRTEPLIIKL